MFADPSILPLMGVVFLATLVRSTFGFGEALVAVPLLALIIPIQIAVPFATLLSITVAGLILAQDWQKVHTRSAWWLILPTLVGIPIGLLILMMGSPSVVKAVMGSIIIGFSGYCLLWQRKLHLPDDRLAWAFRIRSRGTRRCLWHEWASAGCLWHPPRLDSGTLPGHSPGLLSSGQRGWHDRILGDGIMGA